jgi:D-alanyl-D-alanine carboxypeptidase (penicillin-binding protein 5/6)
MTLIAVIMGSPSRDDRNGAAVKLLNYGFSNFTLYSNNDKQSIEVPVIKGKQKTCHAEETTLYAVIDKKNKGAVEKKIDVAQSLVAPVKQGQQAGTVTDSRDDKVIGVTNIVAAENIHTVGFFDILLKIFAKFTFC